MLFPKDKYNNNKPRKIFEKSAKNAKKETTIARDLFVLGLSRISQQVKLA
jgi:hypothetical protein